MKISTATMLRSPPKMKTPSFQLKSLNRPFVPASLLLCLWTMLQWLALKSPKSAPEEHQGRFLQETYAYLNQLNDKTIHLSPTIQRNWPDNNNPHSKSQRKLILTDFGWNHPNQTYALSAFTRGLRSREFLQAFVDHPDFDPTFRWSDMLLDNASSQVDPSMEYVVLMDIETCFDSHYPHYTGTFAYGGNYNNLTNADEEGGRVVDYKQNRHCYRIFPGCSDTVRQVLQSPLFTTQAPNSTHLVYMECAGNGPAGGYRTRNEPTSQLTLLSASARPDQLNGDSDMGFPGLAIRQYKTQLTPEQEQAIRSCQSDHPHYINETGSRPHLFAWIGDGRKETKVRGYFFHQGNAATPEEHVVIEHDNEYLYDKSPKLPLYKQVLPHSVFVGTPRGTNLAPYRLPEALSAGAIPVIVSDGWVPPFRPQVVDWNQCAVLIPDEEATKTLEILRTIPPERRCQMRQYCYFHIYQKYMIDAKANLDGVLEGLESVPALASTQQ